MGASIGQSVFRAIKETFTKAPGSAQGTAAPTPSTAAPAGPQGPHWQQTADTLMQGLLNVGFVKGITKSEVPRLQSKVHADIQAFIRDNPKASKETIDAQARTIAMRHLSLARGDKQREAKIKERLDELRSDLWR